MEVEINEVCMMKFVNIKLIPVSAFDDGVEENGAEDKYHPEKNFAYDVVNIRGEFTFHCTHNSIRLI